MKVFTIAAIILLVFSNSVFSGGQNEEAPMMDGGMMEQTEKTAAMDSGSLVEFRNTGHAMELAESGPTVLFFNASWCPSCKSAMKDFESNIMDLKGINLLLVDYDDSPDLQKKYGVTYQHTFIQIDKNGESLVTWNGGGTKELLNNIMNKEM